MQGTYIVIHIHSCKYTCITEVNENGILLVSSLCPISISLQVTCVCHKQSVSFLYIRLPWHTMQGRVLLSPCQRKNCWQETRVIYVAMMTPSQSRIKLSLMCIPIRAHQHVGCVNRTLSYRYFGPVLCRALRRWPPHTSSVCSAVCSPAVWGTCKIKNRQIEKYVETKIKIVLFKIASLSIRICVTKFAKPITQSQYQLWARGWLDVGLSSTYVP